MKVFKDLNTITIDRPVATIGIFDGVHLAHQAVIRKLKKIADELDGESTIITLWPHPRLVLQKDAESLQLLNTMEEKIRRLEKSGIENLIIIPFDKIFAQTDFSDFVHEILVDKIGIAHLVVGFNHQFGRDRGGNYENLLKLSQKYGFGLSRQAPVLIDEEKVSSSAIRKHLQNGDIERANHYLAYNFCINGKVVEGNQKGREIGFPTANIHLNHEYKIVPKDGVYAVLVHIEGDEFKGMMNIGCRPTLGEDCRKSILEVHLFEFKGNLYNKKIRVEFIQGVREEKKFKNLEELKLQLESDKQKIIEILNQLKNKNSNEKDEEQM